MTTSLELLPLAPTDRDSWAVMARQRLLQKRIAAGLRKTDAEKQAGSIIQAVRPDGSVHHVWQITRAGQPVGSLWLLTDGSPTAKLVDLDVSIGDAPVAFDAVAEAVRELGLQRVALSLFAGDLAMARLVEGRRYELVSTKMWLDLRKPPPPETRVRLAPMTPQRFAAFLRHGIDEYAREKFESGSSDTLDQARAESQREHDDLLPDGVATPGENLWSAFDGDVEVGVLWIQIDHERAFIYDIEVNPEHRRRGYGAAMLRVGAAAAIEAGANTLGLNVFGPNTGARALYEKSGYATTERIVTMTIVRPVGRRHPGR